jgi:hypothetical protein
MPRVNVETEPEQWEPWDFCRRCYTPALIEHLEAECPDIIDVGAPHPDYSDTEYTCERCNRRLTDADN